MSFEWEYYEIPLRGKDILSNKKNTEKSILVLIAEKLIGEDHTLLRKILQAIQYDLEDDCHIEVIDTGRVHPLGISGEQTPLRAILAFGLTPDVLGLQIRNTPNSFVHIGSTDICFTDSLKELRENKEKKVALWNALKQTFKHKSI